MEKPGKRKQRRGRRASQKRLGRNAIHNVEVSDSTITEALQSLSVNDEDIDLKESVPKKAKLSTVPYKTPSGVIPQGFLPHLDVQTIRLLEEYNVIFTSTIRVNPKCPKEAYLPNPNGGGDYIVEGVRDRNRSLDGDKVYAMLRVNNDPSNKKSNAAVVVGIKELIHNRVCVGTLISGCKKHNLCPTDNRLPLVRLKPSSLPPNFQKCNYSPDDLFVTTIVDWHHDRHAIGGSLKFLGKSGTCKAENEAIIHTFGLDVTPYPEEFNRFFPTYTYNSQDIIGRKDYRSHCVFTIDPATAKDLDDALSCEILGDGSYVVGVHIADVSHYLSEGTELDEAVSKRATTVYLVDEVYHMLPKYLCNLCSLTPGEDKLAFSVFWHIKENGEISSHTFRQTIINSCAQLSYEDVQAILDEKPACNISVFNGFSKDDIIERVKILNKFAKWLRCARKVNGALGIHQTKISFTLDERRMPTDYIVEQRHDSHKLIEEFMLLANICVAHTIKVGLPYLALLRNHSPPDQDYLERCVKHFEQFGLVLDISSSKSIQDSINRYSGDNASSVVLNNGLTKAMKRATYFCNSMFSDESEKSHYALSIPLYTHFTSPIRRYADIIVHRLLAAALDYRPTPKYTSEYIKRVAETCNIKKYNAKLAQEASIALYLALFIGERGNIIVEAIVHHVAPLHFEAIVLSTGSHVKVFYNTIDGTFLVEKNSSYEVFIEWADGPKQKISIFSVVNLELTRSKSTTLDARLLPLLPGGV